jgi:hypothetical protein
MPSDILTNSVHLNKFHNDYLPTGEVGARWCPAEFSSRIHGFSFMDSEILSFIFIKKKLSCRIVGLSPGGTVSFRSFHHELTQSNCVQQQHKHE